MNATARPGSRNVVLPAVWPGVCTACGRPGIEHLPVPERPQDRDRGGAERSGPGQVQRRAQRGRTADGVAGQ
ncbi:hypothetical protein ACWEO4_36785 [Streptomyces sp. NPDC004393]|uniref:hypothetical protein n=1 Tax=Streptomyces sp. NPDC004533 TaxID=3154278 RepID=UPI0033A62C2C